MYATYGGKLQTILILIGCHNATLGFAVIKLQKTLVRLCEAND